MMVGECQGLQGSSGSSSPHLPAFPAGLAEPMHDTGMSTQLHVPSASVCFSYAHPRWKLFLRKEVGAGCGPGQGGWSAKLCTSISPTLAL